jgi:hypothetical protein
VLPKPLDADFFRGFFSLSPFDCGNTKNRYSGRRETEELSSSACKNVPRETFLTGMARSSQTVGVRAQAHSLQIVPRGTI